MDTMGKKQVVNAVVQKTGLSKKDTEETIDALLEVITESIRNNKKVNFTGFGAFMVTLRKARVGVNPKTGEKIDIPAMKTPKFKAGSSLKEAVK
jgi:DNA-binding protein HU-beta